MDTHHKEESEAKHSMHYRKLLWMGILSFISMYILMYSMVDKLSNVVPNINQIYMAGLMTSPMIIIELLLMRNMYKNSKLNLLVISLSTVMMVTFFLLIQYQTAVSEKQFLKSMIPHHAAAVLMVKESHINDPEIKNLADGIISSQQREIDFMKFKLKQLDGK